MPLEQLKDYARGIDDILKHRSEQQRVSDWVEVTTALKRYIDKYSYITVETECESVRWDDEYFEASVSTPGEFNLRGL